MRPLTTAYNNLIYYLAYVIAWLLWQIGGKQIRRAFMMSYDDIEKKDVARKMQSEIADSEKSFQQQSLGRTQRAS